MAGETVKTNGIVLDIRPWSRTSHIVTWLTPDHGPVVTLVKGAVRPKSAFLGQYDLFYTCELIYYARSRGELHSIREASASERRDYLRGDFRATAFASYAAYLVKEHCPHNGEAADWFDFLSSMLEVQSVRRAATGAFIALETGILSLAGLEPDFSAADFSADSVLFSIDLGHAGTGVKTVRLPVGAARLVASHGEGADSAAPADCIAAIRFLGLFLRYHLELPPDIRRNTLLLCRHRPQSPSL